MTTFDLKKSKSQSSMGSNEDSRNSRGFYGDHGDNEDSFSESSFDDSTDSGDESKCELQPPNLHNRARRLGHAPSPSVGQHSSKLNNYTPGYTPSPAKGITFMRRRRHKPSGRRGDEPFLRLFAKVGVRVCAIFATIYYIIVADMLSLLRRDHQTKMDDQLRANTLDYPAFSRDRATANDEELLLRTNLQRLNEADAQSRGKQLRANDPLDFPSSYILHDFTNQPDAFSIYQQRKDRSYNDPHAVFWKEAYELQADFAHHYGDDNEHLARAVIHRSFQFLTESNVSQEVALRAFGMSMQQSHTLSVVVFGSSSAAGYGNLAQHAYPNQLTQFLGIEDVHIHSLARERGDFEPTLLCSDLPSADIVIYDQPNADLLHLEATLRHAISKSSHPFALIVVQASVPDAQTQLLQSYVNKGYVSHVLFVDIEASARPFLKVPQSERPQGFHLWQDYASRYPFGRRKPNFTKRQHDFLASLIRMHILSAFQSALLSGGSGALRLHTMPALEAPLVEHDDKSALLLGKQSSLTDVWTIADVQCRTTYRPLTDQMMRLEDLLESGTVATDLDIFKPRGTRQYHSGWVYDIDSTKRTERSLLLNSEHAGFLDKNAAYWGVASSGTITFDIPFSHQSTLMLCGMERMDVSDQQSPSCQLDKDIEFQFTPSNQPPSIEALGSSNCILVRGVPVLENGPLQLSARVTNTHVNLQDGACSISHILWW